MILGKRGSNLQMNVAGCPYKPVDLILLDLKVNKIKQRGQVFHVSLNAKVNVHKENAQLTVIDLNIDLTLPDAKLDGRCPESGEEIIVACSRQIRYPIAKINQGIRRFDDREALYVDLDG
ncbi:OLC1v1018584C1 [Oldenlandia corymbosa var. corymbosa]|uniref:OLC1v1018584C1 n=1 Tax=Oldenlandia corymbosa var. corymbosa TaxID=529605 RepID=A0AAV1EC55_OLDCO|nr:OLC1v1018584C1 [Oldenlandia corymbosa var. corymbosa]